MCIAIAKPADKTIDKDTLRECYSNNPDGAGYAYVHPDKGLFIRKGFFTFDSFYASYRYAIDGPAAESNMLIHFRIKTHGPIDESNCHPHRVWTNDDLPNGGLVFIHNGIINNVPAVAGKSDTIVFNEMILQDMPKGFLESVGCHHLIEEYIGYSKLAFLDALGTITILNESSGQWSDGVWYSNGTYKAPKRAKTFSLRNTGNYGGYGFSRAVTKARHHCTVCGITISGVNSDNEKAIDITGACTFCLRVVDHPESKQYMSTSGKVIPKYREYRNENGVLLRVTALKGNHTISDLNMPPRMESDLVFPKVSFPDETVELSDSDLKELRDDTDDTALCMFCNTLMIDAVSLDRCLCKECIGYFANEKDSNGEYSLCLACGDQLGTPKARELGTCYQCRNYGWDRWSK